MNAPSNSDILRSNPPVGRFAPSPSGRMHLGNLFTALTSWLSVRSRGGRWILRIEDLDPQRSKREYAEKIEEDLLWLGLEWDEGGLADKGPNGPYCQSRRSQYYEDALSLLASKRLLYPCRCRRVDILATQAPHQSDGRIVYQGTCRPAIPIALTDMEMQDVTLRMRVEDRDIHFADRICGPQSVNLKEHCGDFVVRRADGAWAYQLAVVVDDAMMGVTEVIRGDDLLLSTAQQLYLFEQLGYSAPEYAHLPLVRNEAGLRLSKRDQSMSMEALRASSSPEEIIGRLMHIGGWVESTAPISLTEAIHIYKERGFVV